MASRFRHRLPSHGTVAAYLGLFVALSTGGAYAANQIGSKDIAKNAVKSKHIKNAQVKGKDVAADAIDSSKVGDGSLLGKDFGDGQLPAGPKGDTGATGPKGATGPQGPSGATNVTVRRAWGSSGKVVYCAAGERAVGGGVEALDVGDWVWRSLPVPETGTPTGWQGSWRDATGGTTGNGNVYVVCAAP